METACRIPPDYSEPILAALAFNQQMQHAIVDVLRSPIKLDF
jgi:hypothetical protein